VACGKECVVALISFHDIGYGMGWRSGHVVRLLEVARGKVLDMGDWAQGMAGSDLFPPTSDENHIVYFYI